MPFFPTPARIGNRPVINAARAGAQTGALEYQFRHFVPPAARRSMCGVSRSEAPRQPKSCTPRSSKRITIAFGLPDAAFNVTEAWVEAKVPASRDLRDIFVAFMIKDYAHRKLKLAIR